MQAKGLLATAVLVTQGGSLLIILAQSTSIGLVGTYCMAQTSSGLVGTYGVGQRLALSRSLASWSSTRACQGQVIHRVSSEGVDVSVHIVSGLAFWGTELPSFASWGTGLSPFAFWGKGLGGC